jgi:hypothetical protein
VANKNIPTNTGKHLEGKKKHTDREKKQDKEDVKKIRKFIMDEMHGMTNFLRALVEYGDDINTADRNEDYLKRLRDDFRVALKNYENRYGDADAVST